MRVLLGTDGLAGSEAATLWLDRFAPGEPSALCITAIAQPAPVAYASSRLLHAIEELAARRSRRVCEAVQARLADRWSDITVRTPAGDVHEQVLRAADEWRPDLVVLGGGGSPSEDYSPLLGSVARMSARHLACSVLLVDRMPASVDRIVVGMDGSPSAREAVRLLCRLGFEPEPRLLALHVVNTSWRESIEGELVRDDLQAELASIDARHAQAAQAMLARTTAGLAGRTGLDLEIASGVPADVILRKARERRADLVAVGHQGVERIRRLPLGSVAEHLVMHATCPILIART